MKPASFTYHRTDSVEAAVAWLEQNPDGKILAGGQSLIPLMNFRLSRPEQLLDITNIPGLNHVTTEPGTIRIGGLVRHQALADNEIVRKELPVLAEAASHVGHWAIRNRGTIGGSIVHADPAAELPAAVVAFDATLTFVSTSGTRQVAARDFYLGFMTTDIAPGELLTEVRIDAVAGTRYGFYEIARRPGDFALAGAFVEMREDGTGAVTWFGISGGPERRELTWSTDATARKEAVIEQLDTVDILDDEVYRRHAALTVAEKAYERAVGGTTHE